MFWVPGNHEFYGSDYNEYQSCYIPIRENVFLINNQSAVLEDFQLVFSTLWSNLDLEKRWFLQYHINDFKYIKYKEECIDALDYNGFHTDALAFLNKKLEQTEGTKTIVISHHCPVILAISGQDDFLSVYCSPLQETIEKYQPLCWLFGHTHTSNEVMHIVETKLLTNQFDGTMEISELVKLIDF